MKIFKIFVVVVVMLVSFVVVLVFVDDCFDIEIMINVFYDVIFGLVGEVCDFDCMCLLFVENVFMGVVGVGFDGQGCGMVFGVEGYIECLGEWLVENGFDEIVICIDIDIWGEIVVVCFFYEGING